MFSVHFADHFQGTHRRPAAQQALGIPTIHLDVQGIPATYALQDPLEHPGQMLPDGVRYDVRVHTAWALASEGQSAARVASCCGLPPRTVREIAAMAHPTPCAQGGHRVSHARRWARRTVRCLVGAMARFEQRVSMAPLESSTCLVLSRSRRPQFPRARPCRRFPERRPGPETQ